MRAYLASPLGFAESAKPFLRDLRAKLKEAGLDVFDPWTQPGNASIGKLLALPQGKRRTQRLHTENMQIARANEKGIRKSDIVIAILDGVDVDSGTASEIGFAFGLGMRIFGLRTDFRLTGDNDGAIVNLQVQYWIEESGGHICRTMKELLTAARKLAREKGTV